MAKIKGSPAAKAIIRFVENFCESKMQSSGIGSLFDILPFALGGHLFTEGFGEDQEFIDSEFTRLEKKYKEYRHIRILLSDYKDIMHNVETEAV